MSKIWKTIGWPPNKAIMRSKPFFSCSYSSRVFNQVLSSKIRLSLLVKPAHFLKRWFLFHRNLLSQQKPFIKIIVKTLKILKSDYPMVCPVMSNQRPANLETSLKWIGQYLVIIGRKVFQQKLMKTDKNIFFFF